MTFRKTVKLCVLVWTVACLSVLLFIQHGSLHVWQKTLINSRPPVSMLVGSNPQVINRMSDGIEDAFRIKNQHNGTQKPMPVSGEVEKMLLHIAKRSIQRSTPDVVRQAAVVTGCEKSHFTEIQDAIASYQTQYPGRKIIFYDLGLTQPQALDIKTWCDLEYRLFPFDKYPKHFRNILLYGWKAFVMLDVMMEHNAVIWIDASIRMTSQTVIEQLALTAGNSGTALPLIVATPTFCFIHQDMYSYIKTNQAVAKVASDHGTGLVVLVNTVHIFNEVIQWWVRCSYTRKCIAPDGHKRRCPRCNLNQYAECHRYDQSAINLLLLHHFKGDFSRYSADVHVYVKGSATHAFNLSRCT